MAPVTNGNRLVSQAEVGTLAREVPDQELTQSQGHVVVHNTYQFDETCPSHVSRGSLSIVSAFGQPGLNPEVMPELQPVIPL